MIAQKKKNIVEEIMSNQLYTIALNDSLHKADILFSKHNIRHLPVVEGNNLAGMLSLTDLQRISFVNYFPEDQETSDSPFIYDMLTIEQIMTRNIASISAQDDIRDAATILANENFHALPVVDGEELVGIITTTDLINYLLTNIK